MNTCHVGHSQHISEWWSPNLDKRYREMDLNKQLRDRTTKHSVGPRTGQKNQRHPNEMCSLAEEWHAHSEPTVECCPSGGVTAGCTEHCQSDCPHAENLIPDTAVLGSGV